MKKFQNIEEFLDFQVSLISDELAFTESENRKLRELKTVNERKKAGILWNPVSLDEERYLSAGKISAKFSKSPDEISPKFKNGSPCILYSKINDFSLKGSIKKISGFSVEVYFTEDSLPDWAYEEDLVLEAVTLELSLQEMKKNLESLKLNKSQKSQELIRMFAGLQEPEFVSSKTSIEIPHLNKSQNLALNSILNSEILSVFEGPPGTGKSTVLAEAAKILSEQGLRILALAPSNAAADSLLSRIASEGIDVLRIGNPARFSEEAEKFSLDRKMEESDENSVIKDCRKDANELSAKANKFVRSFGAAERQKRSDLRKEARSLLKRAEQLEKSLSDYILDKSNVIVTTFGACPGRLLQGRKFDAVFADEANQAVIPELFLCLDKIGGKLIITGDRKQLPPVVFSESAKKAGLEKNIMELLDESDFSGQAEKNDKNRKKKSEAVSEESASGERKISVLLNEQYRMPESLFYYSNTVFYDSKVITIYPSAPEEDNFLFIDTAGADFFEEKDEVNESYMNSEEASLLLQYFENFVQTEGISAGVLAPYSSQVYLLREKFKLLTDKFPLLSVNTIDSFQGSEKEAILISMTRSNEKGNTGFLSEYKRLNVAMTRARKKLIIVGDSITLTADPVLKKIIQLAEKKGHIRSCYEFME
ncbi:MAG TPA: AAA domain-containing protein [Leptospiraceae bacterium]|nr:AAA domain-containing protein [Leptospiraceae bacterium]